MSFVTPLMNHPVLAFRVSSAGAGCPWRLRIFGLGTGLLFESIFLTQPSATMPEPWRFDFFRITSFNARRGSRSRYFILFGLC